MLVQCQCTEYSAAAKTRQGGGVQHDRGASLENLSPFPLVVAPESPNRVGHKAWLCTSSLTAHTDAGVALVSWRDS